MFGNVTAERAAIELTYDAVCTITRQIVGDFDGIAQWTETVVAENVPCALSKGSDSSANDMAGVISDSRVLFIAPETDIKAGDRVTISLYGRTETLDVLGVPLLYATHKEVNLGRSEHA